jgi:hypothetical protein
LFKRFLHWLEVMSIIKKSKEATLQLKNLHTWAQVSHFMVFDMQC